MTKRIVTGVIMALCLTMTAGADNLGFTRSRPLLFGVDVDYAPLEYVDEHGMPQGLDVKFTQELLRRLNIPYTYSPNSWEDMSDAVLQGKVDLGMMVYSSYRKELTNYSRQVFRLYYQIVFRKDDLKEKRIDLRNLSGLNIAFMQSRPLTDTLTRAGAVPNVVRDLPKAMNDLSEGMYDAIICFRYQANYLIDHYGLKNLKAIDMSLSPREYCYVGPNKALIEAINAELDKMEADGTILEIYGDDVTSQFGAIRIPDWVWYAITALVVAFLLVFIVFQNRYQHRLKREMERAQRSERLKMVFLGNVSHALRTPLNAIIGFSEVLANTDDNAMSKDERMEMFKLINANGNQLLYFINELLQLSNIEGNELVVNQTETNLAVEMELLAEDTRKIVKDGVDVMVEGNGGTVTIDVSLMRLVTMHCLENAAKHTDKGFIKLSYTDKDNGLLISVRDTGCGLPEGLKENIFSLLSEQNTFIQKNVPGLGLSICKAIVERRHGRIGAVTPPDGGTEIWHWIPIKVHY